MEVLILLAITMSMVLIMGVGFMTKCKWCIIIATVVLVGVGFCIKYLWGGM